MDGGAAPGAAVDEATLAVVAHNLRGSLALAGGASRMIAKRWEQLDADRRDELFGLVDEGIKRADETLAWMMRGVPLASIEELVDASLATGAAPPSTSTVQPAPPQAGHTAANGPAAYPVPADEEERLAALHRYGVLDEPAPPDLAGIVELAARIAGAPMAVINLIDRDRQWPLVAYGIDANEVPREEAMCAHTIVAGGPVHVPDSRLDARFQSNPFVTGRLGNLRLYVGVPLVTPDAHAVGTLCVVDEEARSLTGEQLRGLEVLAKQVVALFEARWQAEQLRRALAAQGELLQALERERERNEDLLDRDDAPPHPDQTS